MTFKQLSANVVAILGIAAVPAAAQTPVYRVTNLSAVPDAALCVATAINDSGATAGVCGADLNSAGGAAAWRDGALTQLGMLSEGHYAQGTAINSSGVVAGDGDAGDWQPRPFIATKRGLLNIDSSGGANMRVVGITDTGVLFGNYAKGLSGNTSSWSAVYWTEEVDKPGRYRRTALPRVGGGDSKVNGAWATASNKAGEVAGYVQNSLFGQRGAFWSNDRNHTVVTLEPLAGSNTSWAWGLNDLGQAVGASYFPFVGDRAVLWQNDANHTPVDLGVLPGDTMSTALAANALGQVVGVSTNDQSERRGFLWQNGAMFELAALISAEDGAWTIVHVFSTNNRGEIVALGKQDGQLASVLLTPLP